MKKILVIDDDTYICTLLENFLKEEGYSVQTAFNGSKGLKKIKDNTFDLVISDFRLPDIDGMQVLESIKKMQSSLPVIIMTAYAEIQSAVQLIKAGAYDYITKPIRPEEILTLVRGALRGNRRSRTKKEFENEFIMGDSQKMQKVLHLAKRVAPTDMTVLIEGETGTGKEYVSRAIHYNSKRKDKPFVAVDCGAIPHELANSELFGHVKGSFTGAVNDKKGSFEIAHGGTLFLDEIGNLSYEVQVKLLRVLQERTINRVGENKDIHIDVRIIAATNEPLINMVKDNKFREDVFYRINEFKIIVPPLRRRTNDILVFANYFREMANDELDKEVEEFSPAVEKQLLKNPWYGNLRELKNSIKRAVLLADDTTIKVEHLMPESNHAGRRADFNYDEQSEVNLKKASSEAEKQVILDALHQSNYNKSKAAKMLDIDRKTLYNKINQFNISLSRE